VDRRRWCRRLNRVLEKLYRKASLPASVETFVKIPPHDPPDDVDGTLTAHERAFVRSLYRQNKLRRPRGTIRKPQWHEVTRKGRRVTVTMFSASSGADHVEQHPESSWVEHPELRSHRGFYWKRKSDLFRSPLGRLGWLGGYAPGYSLRTSELRGCQPHLKTLGALSWRTRDQSHPSRLT
jgi:hypothetical protein